MSPEFWHSLQADLLPLTQPESADLQGQAAVLLLLSRDLQPQILYTKRSANLRHHPGEVSFPGGMWEPGDPDLIATALRETCEEIGLPGSAVELLGALPRSQTRAGTWVTPFVASFDARIRLQPNFDELESIFNVPLNQFFGAIPQAWDEFEYQGRRYSLPVYHFEGYRIWGYTAAVTARLLRLVEPHLRSV